MKLTNNLYAYPEYGMMDSNTYVIKGSTGIIFDPGSNQFLPALIEALQKDGIEPKDIGIITNTHLHGDHCGANEAFSKLSDAKIRIHPFQEKYYEAIVIEAARYLGLPSNEFERDEFLDEKELTAGDLKLELFHCPGHSPEGICYYFPDDKALICGDVIFAQNIGRVDLPGGNAGDLVRSIEQLSKLDIEYLLPGHMGIVTGADNVRGNFGFIRDNILSWL